MDLTATWLGLCLAGVFMLTGINGLRIPLGKDFVAGKLYVITRH